MEGRPREIRVREEVGPGSVVTEEHDLTLLKLARIGSDFDFDSQIVHELGNGSGWNQIPFLRFSRC